MKVKNGIKGTEVPTADEAMKMYHFVKDWKIWFYFEIIGRQSES